MRNRAIVDWHKNHRFANFVVTYVTDRESVTLEFEDREDARQALMAAGRDPEIHSASLHVRPVPATYAPAPAAPPRGANRS